MSIIEHIGHPFVSALAWSLLHSMWQLLLIGLLWKLSMLTMRKSHSIIRYRASLLFMLAIPLSFVLTFARQYQVYASARQIVSVEFDTSAWIAAMGGKAYYIIDKHQPGFLDRVDAFLPLIFWLYIGGIVIFTAHTLLSYLHVHRLKTHNVKAPGREWQERIQRLSETVKCNSKIPVRISSSITVPMVLGLIKPVVLMPSAVFFSMDAEQLEAIIMHELYHIKRMDHYVNALQNLLEILFFYHPITWMISRVIRKLREECVDEWVVSRTNSPVVYAQALVNIEQRRGKGALQPALAATNSKNHLLTRIKNFMTMKTRPINAGQKLSAIIAAVLALASIAWINPAKTLDISGLNKGDAFAQELSNHHFDLSELTPAEAEDPYSPAQQEEKSERTPRTIYLHDGSKIEIEEFSEKEREALRKAMEEVRHAMTEVNREVFEKLHSEEFRQEMQKAGEEAKKAGEEVRKAMEELRLQLQDEEFRQEIRRAGEEMKKAMEELDNIEWEAIGDAVRAAMDEVNKNLEGIGPSIEAILRELEKSTKEAGSQE